MYILILLYTFNFFDMMAHSIFIIKYKNFMSYSSGLLHVYFDYEGLLLLEDIFTLAYIRYGCGR